MNRFSTFTLLFTGAIVLCGLLIYRDIELKKLEAQRTKVNMISDCIFKVQSRYSDVARRGEGILNIDEIKILKQGSNSDEDRCIKRFQF